MAKKTTKAQTPKAAKAKTPVAETPATKTPATKTPAAKSPAPKAAAKTPSKAKTAKTQGRGKRYSNTEKAKILTFVDSHDAEKGRGGAAAASRKFKISQLTIGNWRRAAGSPSPSRKSKTGDISKVLKRLGDIHKKMAKVEEELGTLRKEYAALKGQL